MPETQYAQNGGVYLAFRIEGEGPPDILLVNTWVSHVEGGWDVPELARFWRRLGTIGRLIYFDRRGTGLSDAVDVSALPDLETQVADAVAVLEAAGSKQAVVIGNLEGGPVAMLLAATRPERCRSLVLIGTAARMTQAPDYPWAPPEEVMAAIVEGSAQHWLSASPEHDAVLRPSAVLDERARDVDQRFRRAAIRPGAVAHYFGQTVHTDLRDILGAIQTPTLVVQIAGDRIVPAPAGRYLADHITGADYRELPGIDHIFFGETGDAVADEIEEFLTGVRGSSEPDRVLATLLFTDIVGSTARAAELGDRRWRQLLDEHDAAVRRQLTRFGGREIDTAGDGFFAAFDGPGRAIRGARGIGEALEPLDLRVRAGVHTGEVELRGEGMGGLAVHIAARVAALAGADEVLVSGTVKDLLAGSGLAFDDRGERQLKGVPGSWRIYAVA